MRIGLIGETTGARPFWELVVEGLATGIKAAPKVQSLPEHCDLPIILGLGARA